MLSLFEIKRQLLKKKVVYLNNLARKKEAALKKKAKEIKILDALRNAAKRVSKLRLTDQERALLDKRKRRVISAGTLKRELLSEINKRIIGGGKMKKKSRSSMRKKTTKRRQTKKRSSKRKR